MNNNPITTHVLNTALGQPAAEISIALWTLIGKEWSLLSVAKTNADGRIDDWESQNWYQDKQPEQLFGTYKIVFELDDYWLKQGVDAFYPSAEICFKVQDERHHHVPLLLSPYSYSTYRGS